MAEHHTDGRELAARHARGALEGLIRGGEDLLGKAVALAPKDEGTLRGSATLVLIINGARFEGSGSRVEAMAAVTSAARAGLPIKMSAEVAFNTVYAARQHEELDWHHDEGQAKYLEQPLRENAARYARNIALSARRGLH